MNAFSFLLDVSTKVVSSGSAAAQPAATPATAAFGAKIMQNPIMVVVFYCVVLFIAMYFFSIRPTKKREMKLAEIRNAIEIGDMVVTNSGMFGKVVDITAECMIVEFGTNKGVRIPVLKYEIYGKREPNLTNKVEEAPEAESKKGFGGLFGKKKEEGKQDL